MKWAAVLIGLAAPATAECVSVRFRDGGPVCLDTFACTDVDRSSQVARVCYDQAQRYLLMRLKQRSGDAVYYHYCEVPKPIVDEVLAANSMGGYYISNIRIRGAGTRSTYSCQYHPAPRY